MASHKPEPKSDMIYACDALSGKKFKLTAPLLNAAFSLANNRRDNHGFNLPSFNDRLRTKNSHTRNGDAKALLAELQEKIKKNDAAVLPLLVEAEVCNDQWERILSKAEVGKQARDAEREAAKLAAEAPATGVTADDATLDGKLVTEPARGDLLDLLRSRAGIPPRTDFVR